MKVWFVIPASQVRLVPCSSGRLKQLGMGRPALGRWEGLEYDWWPEGPPGGDTFFTAGFQGALLERSAGPSAGRKAINSLYVGPDIPPV